MRTLIDTHTFLWWQMDDAQLSQTVRDIIANPKNTLFLSVASVWEIVICIEIVLRNASPLRLPLIGRLCHQWILDRNKSFSLP